MAELNSVQKFYAGKTIFITGASGFMGKVLVQKLLSDCSELKEIIILMRDKKGVSSMQRVEKWKKLALFEPLMADKPDSFSKITPLHGDLLEPNYGLSDADLKRVEDTTQIFFHMAASLKMEAALRYNIRYNMVGTQTALEIAKRMKNLIQMVHLSTAFCNVEPEIVYEKVYDFPHEPEDLLKMAEWMTDEAMEAAQAELIKPHPNTYTYTKRLAEIMVQREYKNLPVCIVRPSVVLPSYEKPIPGWVDSLNGVVGIFHAGSKGVLRSMLADPKAKCEYVPVDVSIDAIIMIAKVLSEAADRAADIPVYHLTVHPSQRLELGYIFGIVKKLGSEYPASWPLWYPDGGMTTNKFANWYRTFFFMMLPAYFIDFLLKLFGQKTFMLHVQKMIATGAEVLQFFTMRNWKFDQENFLSLIKKQSPEEYNMFMIDCLTCKDQYQYIKDCVVGGRQYCCRDPLSTLPTARVVNKIQYVLHIFCQGVFYFFVITTLLKILGLFEPLKATFTASRYIK